MPGSITLKAVSYATPDGVPLLTNLDLSFGPVRTGLIGRNGVGKSTLLRLINGEIPPPRAALVLPGLSACCVRWFSMKGLWWWICWGNRKPSRASTA
jgi:ABC-type transport system involved in cytochrome bd biosynthesis fused ATPase/permease subunit